MNYESALMRVLRAALLAVLLGAAPARADAIVIIVHPESGVEHLTREEVANVFLGRYKKLPSGLRAQPIDAGPVKEAFYSRLVGKTLAEINAYWARLIFSGQTTPPRQVGDHAAALATVAAERGAIAYIESRHVDKRVRVVLELE